jgi:hypothetical protein
LVSRNLFACLLQEQVKRGAEERGEEFEALREISR